MKDGYITIREHKEERNMWAALSFGAGSLFIALVNVWLVYLGVSL